MENIKVYRMDDCEWWASKWDKERTNDFFNEEYGTDNELEDIKECDIDKEGMWCETADTKDTERLGEYEELISTEKVNGMTRRKISFGDLIRKDELVFKYIPFREVLKIQGDFQEPYMIATTEW